VIGWARPSSLSHASSKPEAGCAAGAVPTDARADISPPLPCEDAEDIAR